MTKRTAGTLRIRELGSVVGLLCSAIACGTGNSYPVSAQGNPPTLTAATADVFVGERTSLTAIFDGERASIDGIGSVQSGVPVQTPPLARTTTFSLHVVRGAVEVDAQTTVRANYRNRIRFLAAAPIAQTNHVAAALPDGRAIVMGGNTSAALSVPDSTLSQIFDPATERFTPGPDLPLPVQTQPFTSVAQLASGGFLLAGAGLNAPGNTDSVVTQLFDAATPGLTRVGDTATRNTNTRTATGLLDGGVLLSGGLARTVNPVTDVVDRYDASSAQWQAAGRMNHVRVLHTATLLRDGRVLVTGGLTCCQVPNPSPEFYAETAEIYDPAADRFTPTGSMTTARGSHAAALLPDGRVLVTGGNGNDAAPFPRLTEIFDPASGQFTPAGELQWPRDSHFAVTLTDGRVLVIGGEAPPDLVGSGIGVSATEIFDPATGRWNAGPVLQPAFFAATVTMLGNGKVLVFGGQDVGGFPQSAVALFE